MTDRRYALRGPATPATPAPPPGGAAAEEPGAFLARLEGIARSGIPCLSAVDAAALNALAAACARGAGARDLALGAGLDLLARTGGEVRLGYSGIGDLARERLGLPADQARRLRRDAARLRSRPLLREAVLRGEVTLRKAEVVLPEAVGPEEAYWVARARVDTVRRLEAAVRSPEHAEDDWHRLRIGLPPEQAKVVEVALEVAGVLVGPAAPLWKRIEAIAMEFLGEFPIDPLERMAPRTTPSPPAGWAVPPVPAPPPDVARPPPPDVACGPWQPAAALLADIAAESPPTSGAREASAEHPGAGAVAEVPAAEAPSRDPYETLARLARLLRERAEQDEQLGRACLLVRRFGAWRQLGFVCFEEWCAEWLGLAPSTVRQRAALERRMQALPELRDALRSGRLSYEQARLVARVARPSDVAARIEEAAATTCIGYRRELEGEEHRQMWRAGELRAVVPEEVGALLADALRALRARKRGLSPGQALLELALHFILTWKDEVNRLVGSADRVILRDGGLCQIPGCSRPADHVHHIRHRSAGGPLEPWNELALCAVHHLRAVHAGFVSITGCAPDGLAFVLGEREVAEARA